MSEARHRPEVQSGWASYHIIFNLGPYEEILLDLVLPAVRDLWSRRRFLRFFFIRYGEGGPHIRLRFRCSPEDREDIDSILKLHAARFCHRSADQDSALRVAEVPFEPETHRYGGTGLIEHSFDFFCLTSSYVLYQLGHNRRLAKSKLLALAVRTLVRQALGFAADEDEIARLAAYAVNGNPQRYPSLEERADREFQERKEDYVRLITEEIECAMVSQARSQLAYTMLTDGALLLNRQVRGASDQVRWRILCSQLHMTWNRMGILNLEEIYLGHILWRTMRHVETNESLRSTLADVLAEPRLSCESEFEALIDKGITQLVWPCGVESPDF